MKTRDAKIVIIGSGAAGLACALALAPTAVTVLTKTTVPESGSSLLAQGGIAVAMAGPDSADEHAADTCAAADGLADAAMVQTLTRAGADAVRALIEAGLPVDRHRDGSVALGHEAAHSQPRIVHAGGDAIGKNLLATLLTEAAKQPSITLACETMVVDLAMTDGRVSGVVTCGADCGWMTIAADAVVIATGGVGALWQATTNPAEATGDGLALAARVGAKLADLEFVQFHPTALQTGDCGARLPLLTEALRGAGARLTDDQGGAIMAGVDRRGDLAPRDVVARAIWRRQAAGEPVFLDLRPALAARGSDGFPQAMALCLGAGYDPTATPVPVVPAAHYHMGGIASDDRGRTSVAGLWAVGEAATTGVHGANRLASNSLLEALVFARRVARDVQAEGGRVRAAAMSGVPALRRSDTGTMRDTLRKAMAGGVGIVRDAGGLSRAWTIVGGLECQLALGTAIAGDDYADVRASAEIRNMLLAVRLIIYAAIGRQESRGAHFRQDYPMKREGWAHRQFLTVADVSPGPARAVV